MAKRDIKLNDKQKKFAWAYVNECNFNGKQAAIKAGYSPKSAEVQGSKLLTHPKVSKEINRLKLENASKAEKTKDDILKHLDDVIELFILSGKHTKEALKAIEIKAKMCGWSEAEKIEHMGNLGMNINIIKPDDNNSD